MLGALCQPKTRGGFGLRKFKDVNDALLSKLAWMVATNSNCLWVRLINAKYCSHEQFLAQDGTSKGSFVLQSIYSIKYFIRQGCCSMLGNGATTTIWCMPWIPNIPNGLPIPKDENASRLSTDWVAKDLLLPNSQN